VAAEEPTERAVERLLTPLAPVAAVDRRRALVIVNPFATSVSDRLRNLVVHALAARYTVEAAETQRRGHASELARDGAAAGFDLVIAFGGDGTVNEAANGLAGSCKLLGIPGEIVDATEHLLAMADRFAPRRVDLGEVEGRLYTFSAGVGIDAAVVRRVDSRPALKARLGPYFFLATALATFARRYLLAPARMFVNVGGETFSGVTVIVQNAEHYTYFHDRPVDMADGATLEGGTLSGVLLRRASLLGAPSLAARGMLGGLHFADHRHVIAFRGVTSLTVSSATGRALPLQVDGDYIGDVTEARFGVRPRALSIVS
jgi:diacylglycerol kinase family enzyme